ncbi:MAG: GNAT family N-acetyltransferase [Kofleriaceae bacterium]
MLKLGSRSPLLLTERLALRELRDDDAPAIALGAGDPTVARFLLAIPSPYPVALARRWVTNRRQWWRTGRGITLAITERLAPEQLLGTVSLRRYTRDRRAELGYWLASAAWGNGIATEATRAAVEWGFSELNLARIYAQVLADNRGSQRVLDKLGMVVEGIKRQHVRKGSVLHDVLFYGLLRAEWSAR